MNFEMVGKLRLGKETDKFIPYQERTFDSGWTNRTLLFNAICGDNRHLLTIQGGTFPNKKDYKIITFGPSGKDDNGNFVAGERYDIPWKDRLLKENVDKVAQNRRYIIDLDIYNRRKLLERLADKIHEGTALTDEELKSVGLTDEKDVNDALDASNKKRHEFISQWDQAEFMKKVLESDKYADKKFFIRGTIEKRYSLVNKRWYESYVPQRIYLATDDAEEYSTGNAVMYYNKNAIDENSVEKNGKYYIEGFTFEYDSTLKKQLPSPIQLVICAPSDDADEKTKKLIDRMVGKFRVDDDSWKQYGVEFNMLNGSQRVQITEDMLTDDQKEDLECGLITMDDIRREFGDSIYGDRVQEFRFVKPFRGYTSGPQNTVYTDENFELVYGNSEDVTDGLFEDDDL